MTSLNLKSGYFGKAFFTCQKDVACTDICSYHNEAKPAMNLDLKFETDEKEKMKK